MVLKVQIFWTCLVVTFVFCAESHCLQKVLLPKNWGPQSMLYLKGKYGRRFIPDSEVDLYQSALRRLYSVIRDFERLKSRQMRRWTRLFTAQNLMIRYTQET